ncbi:MAG: hypothetical protein CYG59_03175, partial [Chloroflexi bacterium]
MYADQSDLMFASALLQEKVALMVDRDGLAATCECLPRSVSWMDSEELSFGQWVRQRRQALHLTQQQLGALSGCAAETIRKIESDLRSPSPKVALLIAQALQLRPTVHMAFVRWARGDIVHMPALLSDNAPRVALSYG